MDEIKVEILRPLSLGAVRIRITDRYGRSTETAVAPELSVGSAVRIAAEEHYGGIAKEQMKAWAYPMEMAK